MVVTVVIVLFTHNLALGVMVGIVLSTIVFGWKMAKIKTTSQTEGNMQQYKVSGQLFFATISFFMDEFQYETDPDTIIIDFSSSHIWDQSAVIGISKIIDKYERLNKKVIVKGLNEESKKIVRQIGLTSLTHK